MRLPTDFHPQPQKTRIVDWLLQAQEAQRAKLTPHQRREAIKRRDQGDETLDDIGRSYNVSPATISRLTA
jgi:hypothetical protein